MRTLIAITCFAVLAAVGYYFWQEYQAHLAAEAAYTAAQWELICSGEVFDPESVRESCEARGLHVGKKD